MNARSIIPLALLSVLIVGSASAIDVSTSDVAGPYAVGDEFTVTATFSFTCVDEGPEDATYKATIVDAPAWINASEEDVAYTASECIAGTGTAKDSADITVTVVGLAPAFTDVELIAGLVDTETTGGNFTIQQKYVPSFSAPNTLSVDSVAGGATATIPLNVLANADSEFTFTTGALTFDGAAAPEGAAAHIQDNLSVTMPTDLSAGETVNVDLHFGDHGDHTSGDSHDAMEGGDDMAMDDGAHFHWETAQVTVSITLAAADDSTQASEAQDVVVTFVNTDPESLPHADDTGNSTDDDEGLFTPNVGPVAFVGGLGLLAVLRRRF